MARTLIFVCLLFLTPALFAQDEVFVGTPTVRVDSDGSNTQRTELSTAAGQKYECRIVRKGRKYLWASRGNRELDRVDAGDYVYFISPDGAGYVKVLIGSSGPGPEYFEQLSSALKTVTYWGERVTFRGK